MNLLIPRTRLRTFLDNSFGGKWSKEPLCCSFVLFETDSCCFVDINKALVQDRDSEFKQHQYVLLFHPSQFPFIYLLFFLIYLLICFLHCLIDHSYVFTSQSSISNPPPCLCLGTNRLTRRWAISRNTISIQNISNKLQLLVAILHTTNAKLDYPALAEYMGPGTTTLFPTLSSEGMQVEAE